MMGFERVKAPEEILQKYWEDSEGEMTFDLIIDAMTEYGDQFTGDSYDIGVVDDPFNED